MISLIVVGTWLFVYNLILMGHHDTGVEKLKNCEAKMGKNMSVIFAGRVYMCYSWEFAGCIILWLDLWQLDNTGILKKWKLSLFCMK